MFYVDAVNSSKGSQTGVDLDTALKAKGVNFPSVVPLAIFDRKLGKAGKCHRG